MKGVQQKLFQRSAPTKGREESMCESVAPSTMSKHDHTAHVHFHLILLSSIVYCKLDSTGVIQTGQTHFFYQDRVQ